jgi:mannose-1-phosphate guanylyltransferase
VLGDGARVGERARLRDSIVLPGTQIAPETILIGAIAGHSDIVQSLRRRFARAVS